MAELTAYEARQVAEIADWKMEAPGRLSRALQAVRRPLGRVVGKAVPASTIRAMAEKADVMLAHHDGLQEIARLAGVREIGELKSRPLEDCDRLAATISARAQQQAVLEGFVAGVGGIATELLNIPVLIAAAERAIHRIGHCYGYRLEADRERLFVLGILELSTEDDPSRSQNLRARLNAIPTADAQAAPDANGLNGLCEQMVEDLAVEAVPFLGDAVSVVLDYAFMRRVDVTARRVFQERRLREQGKVSVIAPSALAGTAHTGRAARELLEQAVYLGGFGVAFALTLPFAAAGRLGARLPSPVVQGATDGARDAAASADQLREGWRSLPDPGRPEPQPGVIPA